MAETNVHKLICENRRARRQYEITDTFECGLVLRGTEGKTLRGGQVSIAEAYARFDGDELFLVGAHIEEYTHGNRMNHVPTRKRKLLLHKRQIRKLLGKVEQRGFTLVPLEMFFTQKGWAKISIGLAKGRKNVDKRQVERSKAARDEIRSHD